MAHSHAHNINKKFIIGILLNSIFIGIEIFYGLKANSLALIADAAHNAGDVLSLLVAWGGFLLANKKAPKKFTYGYKNATVMAAFINALLLLITVGGIIWEALDRFVEHRPIASNTVILVAAIGVVINGLTAFFFYHQQNKDINMRGVFLHMLLDAMVSIGVIIAGIIIFWKSWFWIDPIISILIAAIIMFSSWGLFKESLNLILLAVPTAVNLSKLEKLITRSKGLISYHDLHIWPISTTEIALSAHLVVSAESFSESFSKTIEKEIKQNFPISHVTLQLELLDSDHKCETQC